MNAHKPIPSWSAQYFTPSIAPEEIPSDQLVKLDTLIRSALAAREAAMSNMLFATSAGHALVNAMHDLTECDALYDKANDIAREIDR